MALGIGRALVRGVIVRSNVTPNLALEDPLAPAQGGGLGDLLMRAVKPSITLRTPGGPVTVEPWGSPEYGGLASLLVGLGALGVVYLSFLGARSLLKR